MTAVVVPRAPEAEQVHDYGPLVCELELLDRLRALRLSSGLSRHEAARGLEWSVAKLDRLESGRQPLLLEQLWALLRLCGLEGAAEWNELTELGRLARRKGWWDGRRPKLPKEYRRYVGLEYGARQRYHVGSLTLPDLLRTPDYCVVVDRHDPPMGRLQEAVRVVQERGQQSQTSTRDVYVVSESVLRRGVGRKFGSDLMRKQLNHLRFLLKERRLRLHVVPLEADYHPLLGMDFTVLDFGPMLSEQAYERRPEITPYVRTHSTWGTNAAVQDFIVNHALSALDSFSAVEVIYRSHRSRTP